MEKQEKREIFQSRGGLFVRCGKAPGIAAAIHIHDRGTGDKVGALSEIETSFRTVRTLAMRVPLLAIAVLLMGGAVGLADDMPQTDAGQAPAPGGPVKIIDAAPAPVAPIAPKADQAQPPPPQVSTQAKTQKEPERPVEDTGGRFSFVRVDDGFLRFDLKTGQVAYCNSHADGWGCQAVPENRSMLEREVKSLKDEIAGLKRELENLREPPPPRPPKPVPPAQGDITRDLPPGHDDIARAKAMLQDVWDRLVAAIVGIKNDVMRKS